MPIQQYLYKSFTKKKNFTIFIDLSVHRFIWLLTHASNCRRDFALRHESISYKTEHVTRNEMVIVFLGLNKMKVEDRSGHLYLEQSIQEWTK